MEIITDNLNELQEPPAPKRWKNIWKRELEFAVNNDQDLYSPDYNEIKRQRKKRKVVKLKTKRKIQKKKKSKR